MSRKPAIAIIGGGIAGLSAAFQLNREFDLTLYEKEEKLGGHTDTHAVKIKNHTVPVDTGFIVFCRRYYPVFCNMLDQLGVASKPTKMSFSLHNHGSGLIYNATSLNKLFCQRKNLVNAGFYRMLFDLIRFYLSGRNIIATCRPDITVAEYLRQHHYSPIFMHDHLFPMIGALWSATPAQVAEFPVLHLVRFMRKHGMMKLLFRPQWSVIEGGSERYVQALRDQVRCDWKTGSRVVKVTRAPESVTVISHDGSKQQFDAVVFAAHADQVLAMIDHPSDDEQRILGSFAFQHNQVTLHRDPSVMPPLRAGWACWNTETELPDRQQGKVCTANYWMNELQGLAIEQDIFTSLNSRHKIAQNKILAEISYAHPVFNAQAVSAQQDKELIDGVNRSYYAGAYWGWGFHEDGARSALHISRKLSQDLLVHHD